MRIEHAGRTFELDHIAPLFGAEQFYFEGPDELTVNVTASRQVDCSAGTITEDDHLVLDAKAGTPPDLDYAVPYAKAMIFYQDMSYPPTDAETEAYQSRVQHAAQTALAGLLDN